MKSYPAYVLVVFVTLAAARGQQSTAPNSSNQDLQRRVEQLETEVAELKQLVRQLQPASTAVHGDAAYNGAASPPLEPAPTAATPQTAQPVAAISAEDRKTLGFLRDSTINFGIDTYYAYNFNNPVGRVNLLRAYDVLSNEFSLNQASVVAEHAPDVASGRRWGGRLDLQFGQATDTLQGNPANEPRPQIYRNIFQVYGTYVIPRSEER